jgi:hypothetical protein
MSDEPKNTNQRSWFLLAITSFVGGAVAVKIIEWLCGR